MYDYVKDGNFWAFLFAAAKSFMFWSVPTLYLSIPFEFLFIYYAKESR